MLLNMSVALFPALKQIGCQANQFVGFWLYLGKIGQQNVLIDYHRRRHYVGDVIIPIN